MVSLSPSDSRMDTTSALLISPNDGNAVGMVAQRTQPGDVIGV